VNRLCILTACKRPGGLGVRMDLTERKATWWSRSTELDSYLEDSEFDPRLDLCKNVSCSQAENITSTRDKELAPPLSRTVRHPC
jgi:hypothetical protein